MDLDLAHELDRFGLRPRSVIHVGGHDGQEYQLYRNCGIARQVWVEPQLEVFARLQERVKGDPDVRCINAACGPNPGHATMHLIDGNDGKSSSLLEPTLHLERWPEFVRGGTIEVDVVRLDDLVAGLAAEGGAGAEKFDLLCLDVQGFEMEVLRGATALLGTQVDCVVTEVAAVPLFKGGCLVGELDEFFENLGFVRVTAKWAAGCAGDAMYVRRKKLSAFQSLRLSLFGARGKHPPKSARDWARVNTPGPGSGGI